MPTSAAVHVRAWATSRKRSAWTATRLVRCWSPLGSRRRPSTPPLAIGAERPAGVGGPGRPHRGPRPGRGQRTLTVLRKGARP